MRVPSPLASAFDSSFEELIARFSAEKGLLPDTQSISSVRFLARSVVPHIRRLSDLFNRVDPQSQPTESEKKGRKKADQESGLSPYWNESSNPAHLRLAYFLYFMPCNLYRMASIWGELARLGYRWSAGEVMRGIEFGAGPAPGACGTAAAARYSNDFGLPKAGNWALIEQDRAMLKLGTDWAQTYASNLGFEDWGYRPFQRKIDLKQGFLPRNAPKFNIWLMSYFLNEFEESPAEIAQALLKSWERHLDDEGIAILMEPALRLQSRKLLEIRRELIREIERRKLTDFKLLLPCLGHQSCGALADAEDWCHEEVSWWRPPYFRQLDKMAELDRKTLPFSYLVIARSARSRDEILPALAGGTPETRYRLVSPSHKEGRELEFFVCGQEGKRRSRFRPDSPEDAPGRGDILLDVEIRGDMKASRIEKARIAAPSASHDPDQER